LLRFVPNLAKTSRSVITSQRRSVITSQRRSNSEGIGEANLSIKSITSFTLPEELNQKLVTPYFTLISEGKTEEAYQKFTTDRYKAQYALADYQANYQRIERERGRLNRWKVFDREETYNVIDGSRLLRVKVDCYLGEKNYFINIVLELTKDAQGNYKVDGFFMKNLIGGYPGPW
jgi:hypothetical protein